MLLGGRVANYGRTYPKLNCVRCRLCVDRLSCMCYAGRDDNDNDKNNNNNDYVQDVGHDDDDEFLCYNCCCWRHVLPCSRDLRPKYSHQFTTSLYQRNFLNVYYNNMNHVGKYIGPNTEPNKTRGQICML